MREIRETRFSKVGTNPYKYIDNYLINFNEYKRMDQFEIKNNSILDKGVVVFQCDSDSTFRQNLDCWTSLGLMIKENNLLTKIVDQLTKDKLFEYIKGILFSESDIDNQNVYRNTILMKILYINNVDILKENISMRERELRLEDLKDEIGKFEKILSLDEKFVKMVKIMWGANEN